VRRDDEVTESSPKGAGRQADTVYRLQAHEPKARSQLHLTMVRVRVRVRVFGLGCFPPLDDARHLLELVEEATVEHAHLEGW
jgi:hypothetical protein